MELVIREAAQADLDGLLDLCAHLHTEEPPEEARAQGAWTSILADPNHHLLLGTLEGRPVTSCALVVVPNLTRGARPYALIENVVTHQAFRGQGYATTLLRRAVALAAEAGCYKIMLLTGRKDAATLDFYRNAGFQSEDKRAFIQWLK